jgi:hypothetical protein
MFNQAIAFLIVGPTCLVIAALGCIMLARSITGREKQISWLVIFVLGLVLLVVWFCMGLPCGS